MPQDIYVSITGLQVCRVWHVPAFWVQAARSMAQARKAPGNISAAARTLNGVHHTLSVWTDRDAMRAYLTTGPHLQAMRLFPRIATGKVVGYHATEAPDWSDVHAIWVERGRVVGGDRPCRSE
jgi:quinol monooxygenase YgiN